MKTFQKILLSFLIILGLFWAFEVLAGLVPCDTTEHQEPCTPCHFFQLASNIINFLIWDLSIPIAAVLFIAAGIVFLVSGGSEERVKTAKKIFTNTVIGLLIVFCSWLLIDTLIKTLANPAPEAEAGKVIWAWNTFPSCQ